LKTLSQQTILSNTGTAPGAYLLTFARKFEFVPGQVIGIAMNPAEKPRLYSIASGNNENVVRILYTVKPEGKLTPDMARLQPGDTIYVSEPFGGFLCNEEEQAVWVATGTGIAPFASMFFSGLSKNKLLLQGNRLANGLYFREDFEKEMGARYIPSCTREEVDGIFHGRVLKYLAEMRDLDPNLKYYLCGSAEMVVDVRDLLIERGVPFENVVAEIFF
jgi:ferredoxin/flavodoxin---NADP+ reductase